MASDSKPKGERKTRAVPVGKRSDADYLQRTYLLPADLVKRLEYLSVATGQDRSELMAEALADLLQKHRGKLP